LATETLCSRIPVNTLKEVYSTSFHICNLLPIRTNLMFRTCHVCKLGSTKTRTAMAQFWV